MKDFWRLLSIIIIGVVMFGDSSAKGLPSSTNEQFPPLMSDRLFLSVTRETKEVFLKNYDEQEYSLVEFSDDDKKILIEREVVVSVLDACGFSGDERMSERALQQALSVGWSQRQLNYLQSLQTAFGKIAWGLRILMPCKEKMRIPFQNRYDELNISIMNIGKG
jgi:hypothetical protein